MQSIDSAERSRYTFVDRERISLCLAALRAGPAGPANREIYQLFVHGSIQYFELGHGILTWYLYTTSNTFEDLPVDFGGKFQ